jgi:hypothetical protein
MVEGGEWEEPPIPKRYRFRTRDQFEGGDSNVAGSDDGEYGSDSDDGEDDKISFNSDVELPTYEDLAAN